MRRFIIGLVATVLGATTFAALEGEANAQEIQLTGPLAGPQGRKSVIGMRLYREGRFQIAPSFGFTLLDEYSRAFLVGGTVQYNILDWLGVGVYGAGGIFSSTDLTDQTDAKAPRSHATEAPLPNAGNVGGTRGGDGGFTDQVGRISFMVVPQATVVPFRGKLAMFEKLFVDTDAYIHLGAAIVGVEERGNCGPGTGGAATCYTPGSNLSFQRQGRIAVAPSFGLGIAFHVNTGGIATPFLGIEYRAFPFSWNRGGYDSKGGGNGGNFPDQKVDGSDQTFKFNQMISFNVGVLLGTRQTSD